MPDWGPLERVALFYGYPDGYLWTQKKPARGTGFFDASEFFKELSLLDGTHRANTCTGTAVGAEVRVDLVDVTGADSSDGAFVDASTASNAVVSNFVSHGLFVFKSSPAPFACGTGLQRCIFSD
jgi:hypothetical protein